MEEKVNYLVKDKQSKLIIVNNNIKPVIEGLHFVIVFTIVTTGILYLILSSIPDKYLSTATLFVNQKTPTQVLDLSTVSVSQNLTETFSKIVKSKTILNKVAKELNTSEIEEKTIRVSVVPRTQLIKVGVETNAPELSAQIANKIVQVFIDKVNELQGSINKENRVMIEIAEPAIPDDKTISPDPLLLLVSSLLISLVFAIIFSYIASAIDNSISSEDEINSLFPKFFVLGNIPHITSNNSSLLESLRELRTNLFFLRPDNPPKTIAIISSGQGEGKTFLSLELAKSLAMADKRVLLIDADLRKGGLSKQLELKQEFGLAEALIKGIPIEDFEIEKRDKNLFVLGTGKGPKNPGELFTSKKAEKFYGSLKDTKKYDFVIFDTPPVGAVADSLALAPYIDGSIGVVEMHKTTKAQLKKMVEALQGVKANTLGVVLNKSKTKQNRRYYGKYYHK